MAADQLQRVGLTDRITQEATLHKGLYLARVSAQHKKLYHVITEKGTIQAEISGKLGFGARESADYPVVGDWVMVDRTHDQAGNAIIHHILRRQSLLVRKAAGATNQSQVIAANIDTVFICMSLNTNFNLRRLERYLSVVWDSLATPVVVLTKADLCDDIPAKVGEVSSVALGVDVLITTSADLDGLSALNRYIGPGETGEADKGKHTTTFRQLIPLPNGGTVIDTPGMRELGIESADLSRTFTDINELAQSCRFSDCKHQHEPGCAIKAAIAEGQLSPERLASYQKLQAELGYQGLNSRQIEQQKINRMFGGLGELKQAREIIKEKNRRK